jgi:hypothetical protein
VKGQQRAFDTSEWYDYVTGFVVAGLLSLVMSFLVIFISRIGFFGWFLILAGASTAGVAIAEGVRFVTRKRRSRPLFLTVAAGVVLGALPIILFQLVFTQNLFGILFQVIYLVITVPIVYSRLSGIQLFR